MTERKSRSTAENMYCNCENIARDRINTSKKGECGYRTDLQLDFDKGTDSDVKLAVDEVDKVC